MTPEQTRNLRKVFNLSDPVDSDPLMRAIERANATHYAEASATGATGGPFEITTKADIANSKHRSPEETMKRFRATVNPNATSATGTDKPSKA